MIITLIMWKCDNFCIWVILYARQVDIKRVKALWVMVA